HGSLNPNGMASLLASQKNNIAAALPSGFSSLLGGTGLLDSLGGTARDAAEAANQAARTAGSAAYTAGSAGQHAVSGDGSQMALAHSGRGNYCCAGLLVQWSGAAGRTAAGDECAKPDGGWGGCRQTSL